MKLEAMSQFNRKTSGNWQNMGTGTDQVARHSQSCQQNSLAELVEQKPGMLKVQGSNLVIAKFWLGESDYFIYLKYLRKTYNIAINDIG